MCEQNTAINELKRQAWEEVARGVNSLGEGELRTAAEVSSCLRSNLRVYCCAGPLSQHCYNLPIRLLWCLSFATHIEVAPATSWLAMDQEHHFNLWNSNKSWTHSKKSCLSCLSIGLFEDIHLNHSLRFFVRHTSSFPSWSLAQVKRRYLDWRALMKRKQLQAELSFSSSSSSSVALKTEYDQSSPEPEAASLGSECDQLLDLSGLQKDCHCDWPELPAVGELSGQAMMAPPSVKTEDDMGEYRVRNRKLSSLQRCHSSDSVCTMTVVERSCALTPHVPSVDQIFWFNLRVC